MHIVKGGCHCGNITYIAEFSDNLINYIPWACDCTFCRRHGAAYTSDKNGSLTIKIMNESLVNRYRQGSRIADFLVCKKCGVMTNVCYQGANCLYGSINIRSSDEYNLFSSSQGMRLTQLSDEARIQRWKDNWFSSVTIEQIKRFTE
jgi:hypothetical protein